MTESDPAAKWHTLPERGEPSEWVTETDPDPVPGSIESADAEHTIRDALFGPGA